MKKGLFITIEGVEGSGKTTQTKMLIQHLRKMGKDVLLTRERGGTDIGKKIRQILLHSKADLSHQTETLLYMASRAELVRQVIVPALKRRRVVICDRWLEATIAYQGYGLGVNRSWIDGIAKEATMGIKPDITLLLDVPIKVGLRRVKQRGAMDRIEKRALAFHNRVRRGYLDLAKKRKHIHLIKATTIEETHEKILKKLKRYV